MSKFSSTFCVIFISWGFFFFFFFCGEGSYMFIAFSHFGSFPSIKAEKEARVNLFPIQNSKQCPCIYSCMSFRLKLSPICFSEFLRCKVADFSALSSLPTLQFEFSFYLQSIYCSFLFIFICCCFHYSYLLVSLNINFVFLHPCCFEGVRGFFSREGPAKHLYHLDPKALQTIWECFSSSVVGGRDILSPLWR